MKLYGDPISGNCDKVRFTAGLLGIGYEWIAVDTGAGEAKRPEFRAINDMGEVPVIVLDDGRVLAQSNAIIRYLARGSRLIPEDAFLAAKMDELLFWEQYSHEPTVAVCRAHLIRDGGTMATRDPVRVERADRALDLMERRLSGRDWLVGDGMTLADIALVAYTRLAHEGGFDLAGRPATRKWIARCEAELGL